MKLFFLSCSLALTGAASAVSGNPVTGSAQEPLPRGMQIQLTDEGAVFADGLGMTLYVAPSGLDAPNKSRCTEEVETQGKNGISQTSYTLPPHEQRKSCAQKFPPLLADADARAVGNWTIATRPDGAKQWAYKGQPLYRSIKDTRPGVAYGAWPMARASIGQPPGVLVGKSPVGLIFTKGGRPLYTFHGRAQDCDKSCQEQWQPFSSGIATGELSKDWTVSQQAGAVKQWTYRGKPVYVSMADEFESDSKLVADPKHWQLIIIRPAPEPPRGLITVQEGPVGLQYADADGRTLYVFTCNEETENHVACDDVGDLPLYYYAICGGPEKCMEVWKPLVASGKPRGQNDTWHVISINSKNPVLPLNGRDDIQVWSYRGKPLFRYYRSTEPGDASGLLYTALTVKWKLITPYGVKNDTLGFVY